MHRVKKEDMFFNYTPTGRTDVSSFLSKYLCRAVGGVVDIIPFCWHAVAVLAVRARIWWIVDQFDKFPNSRDLGDLA